MQVYCVMHCIPCEGEELVSVHSTLDKALNEMERLSPNGTRYYNKHFNEYEIRGNSYSKYTSYKIQIEPVN